MINGIEQSKLLYRSTTDIKLLLVETGNLYCSGTPKSGIAHPAVESPIAAIALMCSIFLHVSSV